MKQTTTREEYARYNHYFRSIINLYNTKPQVKTSIELLLTLLTIAFFALFAIRPTIDTISELLAQTRSQKEIRAKLDAKLKSLDEARVVWEQEKNRTFLLDQGLPKSPQPDKLISQVEAIARQRNVVLYSVSIGKTVILGKDDTGESKESEFPISFSVKGAFQDLKNFLSDVENLRRVTHLSGMTISSEKQQNQGELILTLLGSAPYLSETSLK